MADNRPIGVFDSGLGGLSVVRQLEQILPDERIVYFGDTGRVPYGNRSEETIRRYAAEDCRFLLDHEVKFIIAACGTVSSVAPDVLDALPVPAMGVVNATAAAAVRATENRRIGIIGTAATVRSGSFAKVMQAIDPTVEVTARACPMLVSLVETGWIDPTDEVAIPMVRRYLAPMKEAGVDTLILGCTHFPLLAPIIRNELGNGVTLVDSGRETALFCGEELKKRQMLTDRRTAENSYYVSDRPDDFLRIAENFLGHEVQGNIAVVALGEFGRKG